MANLAVLFTHLTETKKQCSVCPPGDYKINITLLYSFLVKENFVAGLGKSPCRIDTFILQIVFLSVVSHFIKDPRDFPPKKKNQHWARLKLCLILSGTARGDFQQWGGAHTQFCIFQTMTNSGSVDNCLLPENLRQTAEAQDGGGWWAGTQAWWRAWLHIQMTHTSSYKLRTVREAIHTDACPHLPQCLRRLK